MKSQFVDNEQCKYAMILVAGSLLTGGQYQMCIHSATAHMSEGEVGANGVLIVEQGKLVIFKVKYGNGTLGRYL